MRRALRIVGRTLVILLAVIFVSVSGCVAHANYRISKDEVEPYDAHAPGKYFTVQGHRLHARLLGDPAATAPHPPLVMLHGFILQGHLSLQPWAEAQLAPTRPVILPDLLGYGFSERVTQPGDHYTLQSLSRDLAGMLDQMGVQQVDLAGHSWGGVVATQFARDYPARVRRLVIIDGAFFFPKTLLSEKLTSAPLGIGRAVRWHMLSGGPGSYLYRVCRMMNNCEAAEPVAHIRDGSDALAAAMYTSRHSTGIEDLEANLGGVGTNTLVLWGALDPITKLPDGERLARALPHARLAVVEDAWHIPWLAEPKETARQLREFLDAP